MLLGFGGFLLVGHTICYVCLNASSRVDGFVFWTRFELFTLLCCIISIYSTYTGRVFATILVWNHGLRIRFFYGSVCWKRHMIRLQRCHDGGKKSRHIARPWVDRISMAPQSLFFPVKCQITPSSRYKRKWVQPTRALSEPCLQVGGGYRLCIVRLDYVYKIAASSLNRLLTTRRIGSRALVLSD